MHPDDIRSDMDLIRRRLSARVTYLPPSLATIHPTNQCNHQCPWCWFSRDHAQIEMRSAIVTLDALVQNGTEEIIVSGGGEPLLHPRIGTLFEFLKRQTGVRRKLYTHGGLVERYFDLISATFDYVRISIDAGDPGTYARLHGTSDRSFDRLFLSATRLTRAGVAVGASMVVTNDNASTAASLIDRCAESGIGYVLLKPVMDGLWRMRLPHLLPRDIPSGKLVDVVIREDAPKYAPTSIPPPAVISSMSVTLIAENAIVPCCHLTSPVWQIGAVGGSLDARFTRRHAYVARRYALSAHSCRCHDVWRSAVIDMPAWVP
jgi:pyruvate-formate lyase-activating enzyme